ncbi:recombinase family protein [Rothia sp. HC945]|uniref:recombinase family protein n=1 Tax=Rothia sp. HC945 TaxID=3171170 RepID=UPI003F1EA401
MNAKPPRRASLYARQSKAGPDGIHRQLPRRRRHVEDEGCVIICEYVDDGLSAAKSCGPNSGWARMLADADAGKIDTVVGVVLDRLHRSLQDFVVLVDHNLVAVSTNDELDLATADDEFMTTRLAALARCEVRRKAERQSRARWQRAQRGRAPMTSVRWRYQALHR